VCVCVCALRLTEIKDRTSQITEDIRHLDQDSEAAQGSDSLLFFFFSNIYRIFNCST